MSARDAARFGLLFLQNGRWNGRQIIPEEWVEESTRPISDASDYISGTYYGCMWWVFPQGYGERYGWLYLNQYQSYAALGAYGQVIQVIPAAELVFVHRVDSYNNFDVSLGDILRLLDMILAAKP
jgi:CubicO group peptidase (beta-lactamase class C family)